MATFEDIPQRARWFFSRLHDAGGELQVYDTHGIPRTLVELGLVVIRTSGRKRYTTLTDTGRALAPDVKDWSDKRAALAMRQKREVAEQDALAAVAPGLLAYARAQAALGNLAAKALVEEYDETIAKHLGEA